MRRNACNSFYAIIFFFFTSAWLESRLCAKKLAPFGFFKKASSFKKKTFGDALPTPVSLSFER
jgi:hypothetical protein